MKEYKKYLTELFDDDIDIGPQEDKVRRANKEEWAIADNFVKNDVGENLASLSGIGVDIETGNINVQIWKLKKIWLRGIR